MAAAAHTHAGDPLICPDPSVHEKHSRLSEAASTAALLVTQQDRNLQTPTSSSGRESVLGPDGRLSSRSAATSLRYAKAQDLPSFPSVGLDGNSAGAAALLAKDYKMKELWQPEMSHAGSKAAIMAHKEGGRVDLWHPSASSAGNSAAAMAMRNTGLSPQVDRGYTDKGRNNSLLAATMVHQQGRQRAGSTPAPKPAAYPDSRNSAQNALNAATVSHRASVRSTVAPVRSTVTPAPNTSQDGWNSEANQAARFTHGHMKPEMFGERPPVEPEVEEQKHNAALRASAVSMAKQMYDYKEEKRLATEAAEAGAGTAHRRNPSLPSQTDLKQEAMQYIHLQDAAHKMAQERLAKMDRDFEAGQYREYYGYQNHQIKQSRLSVRGRRTRAASEGARDSDDSDDEFQARRIRHQMSQLATGVTDDDSKKRNDDRARLLAAAEKRVHARMHDMDEKVFQDTGKVSQAMMDDWEAKAREKAERDRAEREQHPGQTHIGGGKFMSQTEIEAIAAARLQSTFDEINDTAEKRRARDAEIARIKDQQHTERMEEKMKSDEQKAEFRRIRDADKAAARKEKDERRAAKRADQEAVRIRKSEDKRRSRDVKRDEAAAVAGAAALAEVADNTRTAGDVHFDGGKEKRSSRGMLGRITSKLKRRDDNEKSTYTEKDVATAGGATETAVATSSEAHAEATTAEETGPVKDEEHTDLIEATITTTGGIAAAGAIAGIAAAHKTESDRESFEEVSSVSDDDADSGHHGLVPTDTQHTGHYTDAVASPGLEVKPDLERHISMIQDSDDDDDGFGDSDDDNSLYEREPVSPLPLEEAQEQVVGEGTAPVATVAVAAVPVVVSVPPTDDAATKIASTSQSKTVTATAPAPEVKPSGQTDTTTGKSQRGVRGLLGKMRSKRQSKTENSLSSTTVSRDPPRISTPEPIVPIATNTETEAVVMEARTSSVVDDYGSVSSFQRYAQESRDVDDVSSSGAEEEDVIRGRTGRLARKLGLTRDSKPRAEPATSAVDEADPVSPTGNADEQFEEARDHFDEGLAPAPAFAGQPKSHSPARGTKFQEEL